MLLVPLFVVVGVPSSCFRWNSCATSWSFRREWEVPVGAFREMMGLEDRYPKIAELKRNVVEPAMRDVNEFTEFRIRFGQRKVGRTITHFQFAIETESTAPAQTLTGKKGRKPSSRLARIGELILEVEGLDRLIQSDGKPSETDRALMQQREALQRELDELRLRKAGG